MDAVTALDPACRAATKAEVTLKTFILLHHKDGFRGRSKKYHHEVVVLNAEKENMWGQMAVKSFYS
jgi:hypothetical protein